MGHEHGFLEICVDSLAGARAAIAGGADQIELCGALSLGGLTPSQGLAALVVEAARPAGVAVRAMVRPRAGGFDYDDTDVAVAIAEGRALLAAGVDGLVFGAVRDGRLDLPVLERWRDALGDRPPALTLHRAVDVVADPVVAVEEAIALGFDQVLGSGGSVTAADGASTLAAMVAHAAGRCRIVAGAGITPAKVAALVATSGVRAVHASARGSAPPATPDPFGFGDAPALADIAVVRDLRAALDAAVRPL